MSDLGLKDLELTCAYKSRKEKYFFCFFVTICF